MNLRHGLDIEAPPARVWEATVDIVRRLAPPVGTTVTPEFETPLDRSMLSAFALQVNESGGGRVADIGCGVGRATSYLADQDLDIMGVDLSPGMVAVARAAR